MIELKRDTLDRSAVTQVVDYYGMVKMRFPDRAVDLMIVASRVPPERRIACEQYHIEAREIPQKKFRDVAEEVGYTFESERTTAPEPMISSEPAAPNLIPVSPPKDH